jgi:hypothetical protein
MAKIRNIARYDGTSSARPNSTSAILGWPGARKASKRAWPRCAPKPRTRCSRLQHPDRVRPQARRRPRRRSRRCWPPRRASAPGPQGPAHPTGLVVETGSAREVHHFAPAGRLRRRSVHPYLASKPRADLAAATAENAPRRRQALHQGRRQGLLKVMSKMGISTYMSYCGAQIFDAVGLQNFVDKYFTGTRPGRGHRPVRGRWKKPSACTQAFGDDPVLATCSTPAASTPSACAAKSTCGRRTHRQAAALDASGKYDTYKEYAHHQRPVASATDLRGLFAFKPAGPGAARRSRAGQGDRQALRHRRDVARLDLDRGAHHAGDRHEPHRRQVEHRRRRRTRALQAGQGRRDGFIGRIGATS